MSLVLPPGLTPGGGHSLARALTAAVLAMPLVIATVALVPALVICPFLIAAHRRLALRLLASLQQWSNAFAPPARGCRSGPATDCHRQRLRRWRSAGQERRHRTGEQGRKDQ
jgi:hypothetical protein